MKFGDYVSGPLLIHDDGEPFSEEDLQEVQELLLSITDIAQRLEYRDENTNQVACHPSPKILIVSGPGTGKSSLFRKRIDYWLNGDNPGDILVTSFVNKLTADLQNSVNELPEEQRNRVFVTTLHSLSRSIVETNGGTSGWAFRRHVQVIGPSWKETIWDDVLQFHLGELDIEGYPWKAFESQLHNDEYHSETGWTSLKTTYYEICRFYNAAGFADLIIRSRIALDENEELQKYAYFIIDEYQDFNVAEQRLLEKLIESARGVLIVGDDDQVLYDTLKNGRASLVRDLYANTSFTKAMLPLCSRCSFHIVESADTFMKNFPDDNRIPKIFLPIGSAEGKELVQIVGCSHPSAVVDYVKQFVDEHLSEIQERQRELKQGSNKDSFLLVLTPVKEASFLGDKAELLLAAVSEYATVQKTCSQEYFKIVDYFEASMNSNDNYAFRKVLHHEGMSASECHECVADAMRSGSTLSSVTGVEEARAKCRQIFEVLISESSAGEKAIELSAILNANADEIIHLLEESEIENIEREDESAVEEVKASQANAVELMTIWESKGLSADHVILIGFDDVNMSLLTPNAFYVAITRARESLRLITSLRCRGASSAHSNLACLADSNLGFCKYTVKDKKTEFGNRQQFEGYLEYMERLIYGHV